MSQKSNALHCSKRVVNGVCSEVTEGATECTVHLWAALQRAPL